MGIISEAMFYNAKRKLSSYNGFMTWDCSQYDAGIYSIIRQDPSSAIGICKALSAHWIVDHSYGGSLANRVTPNGKLNQSAVRMIMQNFIAAKAKGNQERETSTFMIARGLLQRRSSASLSITRSRGRVETTINVARSAPLGASRWGLKGEKANIAIELTQALSKVNGSYVQISFGKHDGTGHAVAAWIAQDACFYDPNLGEVWFEKKSDFLKWFEYFYKNTYQNFPINFNSYWDISEWGLSIGAEGSAYGKAVRSVAS